MAVFTVDTDQLVGAHTDIVATSDRIRADVALMVSKVRSLEGAWVGGAAAGFQDLMNRWLTMQTNVDEILADLHVRLASARTSYEQVELQNAQMFR